MANGFQMRGTLSLSKETEKFKPFNEFVSKSGWANPRLIFNLNENGCRHSLQVGGSSNSLYKTDESNEIFITTPAIYDTSGQKISDGESEKIPFSQRNDPKMVAKAATWTKYILDLNTPNERSVMKKINQKLAEKEPLGKEDFAMLCVEDLEGAKEVIKRCKGKRFEFLHAKDFIDKLMEVIQSGQYDDKHFFIPRGRFNHSYNPEKKRTYENLEPLQIYLDDETEDKKDFATATVDFYFGKDAVDKSLLDTGKLLINGWIKYKDSNLKKEIFVEKTLVFHCEDPNSDLGKGQVKFISAKFNNTSDDDSLWMIPTDVQLVDGSERVEIKEENLSDEQKQLIFLGFMTFEDIKKQLGGYTYGDSIHEWRWLPKANTTLDKETGYKVSDTVINLDSNLFDDAEAEAEKESSEEMSEDEFDKLFKM